MRTKLLCLLLIAVPVLAQQPDHRAELRSADIKAVQQAAQAKDAAAYRDALKKFRDDFPESSRVLRNLASAEAKAGKPDEAIALLKTYAAMGAVHPSTRDFPELASLQLPSETLASFEKNTQATETGKTVFKLREPDQIAEDIAYDPSARKLYISSVRHRRIMQCDLSGKCEDFLSEAAARQMHLWGILAVHVDARRGWLWATTAAMNPTLGFDKADDGHSALLKFSLRDRKLLKRYEPADQKPHAMGDMTLAPDGTAYVSDGRSGDVYVVTPQHDQLEPLVPPGVFASPQTPALSSDGATLFVPDYTIGIAAIRLSDRSIRWLKSNVPMALEGIDGLYCIGSSLIAVQNGTQPERIVRISLSSTLEITGFSVLEANWAALGDPTHGVVAGNDFYFITNSGWDRVGDDGEMKDGTPAEIRKLPLK